MSPSLSSLLSSRLAPLAVVLALLVCAAPASAREFVRGDANADGTHNITDGVFTLAWLFSGGNPPPCP